MWPMFAFGFGGIFVITQMHGLNWSRWVRGLVLAAYVAGVVAVYAPLGWERLDRGGAHTDDRLRGGVRAGRPDRRRAGSDQTDARTPVSRLRTGPPIAGDPMEVAGIEPAS
jgi:hypothetical protein